MKHWPYSHHLTELVDTPDRYRPFVSDYEMKNLFEVAFLEPEQVKWFKSDFRYVADYFVQRRTTNDYKPSPDTVDHVDAVLKLMSVLTGDDQFEKSIPEVHKIKGGVSMESIFDVKINRAVDETKKETAERMIRAGKLTDADIADYSGLTLTQVKALREEMKTTVMA